MLKFANRVKVNTSTTGTGAITLGATVVGYQSFSDAGILNGDEVRYTIEDGNSWEIGTGVFSSGTMTRSVIESSNSNALLNLSGNAFVFLTVAGQDLQELDNMVPNTRTISTGTGLTGGGNLTANRTLALTAGSIASLALADTAVQPTRSITAGTGLTGGGNLSANRTLALSAGSIASLALADTSVQPTRSISTGTGLTGGGNLSTNRTIALTGQALALHNLAGTGLVARTGTNTFAVRSVAAGDGITVTNGTGSAGNPTISADTTLARSAVTLTAGAGLTGGGNLSANRTFAVDSTVVRTTGNQTIAGSKNFTNPLSLTPNTDFAININRDGSPGIRFRDLASVERLRIVAPSTYAAIARRNNANTAFSAELRFLEGGGIHAHTGFFSGDGSGLIFPATQLLLDNTPGTNTWTKPVDLPANASLRIRLWGAGASGGCRDGSTQAIPGGGGQFVEMILPADLLPASIDYIIGAGGADRGHNQTNGFNGGASTFAVGTIFEIIADGGKNTSAGGNIAQTLFGVRTEAGGNGSQNTKPATTMFSGAGGRGSGQVGLGPGGDSIFGGNGGQGTGGGATPSEELNGYTPGGGGGSRNNNGGNGTLRSGRGGDGQLIIEQLTGIGT